MKFDPADIDFDPNEIEATKFNPSDIDFDPSDIDAGIQKPTSTIGQDIDLGIRGLGHSLATAGQMVGGGVLGLLGNEAERDQIFDAMVERQGAFDKEQAAANQDIGGKVISGLTGIAPIIPLGMVVGPTIAAGGMAGIGALSNAKSNVEAGASNADAITQATMEGLLDTAAMALPAGKGFKKGALWGAGGNLVADIGKDITGNIFTPENSAYDPSLEKYGISAAIGALPGAAFGKLGSGSPSDTKQPKPSTDPVNTPSNILFAKEGLKLVDSRIEDKQAKVAQMFEDGIDVKRDTPILEALDAELQQLKKQKEDLEGILKGETKQDALDRAERQIAKIQELKSKNQVGEELPLIPEDVDSREAQIKAQQDKGPTGSDATRDPYTYIKQQEEPPKTTPTEVALNKITEALAASDAEIAAKIEDTFSKLDTLNDSAKVNALQEVGAMQQILELRKKDPSKKVTVDDLDLSWFEGKQEQPTTEGITVEEILPTETTVEANKPIFTRITDIFDQAGDTLYHLINNRDQFFDRQGTSQIYIDKAFQDGGYGSKIINIISTILTKTGLHKDNIYITLEDNFESGGQLRHFGDTTVIRVNKTKLEQYIKAFDQTPELFRGIAAKNLDQAKMIYATTRVIAHEVGHAWLHKYFKYVLGDSSKVAQLARIFKKQLERGEGSWQTKAIRLDNISPTDFYGGDVSANKLRNLQSNFHEFIAERIAKQLLDDKGLLDGFRKDRSTTLRSVFDSGYEMLRKLYAKGGEVFLNKKKFMDDEISFFLKANEDYVKNTSKTIWEAQERAMHDNNLPEGDLSNLTMQEILEHPEVQKLLPAKKAEALFLGLDVDDSPTTSEGVFRDLGRAAIVTTSEVFNRNNVVDMNPQDQFLKGHYLEQRRIDLRIEQIRNDLWYDQDVPKNVKFWQVFSKVKDAASPYMVLLKSTKQDKYTLHELFKKGFEEGKTYEKNLQDNGSHLTPDQVKYYNTLSKLFSKMYDYSVKTQEALGKKYIMDERAGWYPAVRTGKYIVQVNYGDLTVRAQSFSTKLQAQKFRERLINDKNTNRFEISAVIDKTDKDPVFTNREAVDAIVEKFARLVPQHKDFFAGEGRKVLDAMATRGGKLGFHHEFRENMAGYKGNELFLSAEDLGESFGMAIESAIAEKAMQLKEMEYRTKFLPILEDPALRQSKPNSIYALQTMYDSALGKHEPVTGTAGDKISHAVDVMADRVLQWFGSEKTSDQSIVNMTVENVRETFYLLKMMPKAVFSTIGQIISVPSMTIAKMSYDTPLKSYATFAKGVLKLTSGNKELWDVLKDVSQRTDVFEPQFIESLSLKKHEKAFIKHIKDWVLLQAPGRGSESLSRIIAFSTFYEHYKGLGMSKDEAINQAIIKAGDTLNLYDKANTAPIFEHLGPVGQAIKPLQGFGQNMLGNIIGMVRYGTYSKNFMPLVNFTLMTVAMSGVMGLPFIQDYEKLRLYLASKGNYDLPSILDIVGTRNEPIDQFIEPETRLFGLPSLSRYDLASSTRANQTLFTLAAGVFLGNGHPLDMMPMVDWAMSVPGAIGTLGKGVTGAPTSSADMAKAVDVLAPAGHLGYGIKEAMNLNTTRTAGTPTNQRMIGKEGGSGGERTVDDIKAGILGTKTTKARKEELVNYDIQEKEKGRAAKIDKAGILLTETGDEKYLKQLEKLGATEEQILNKMSLEYYNRHVPLTYRQVFNKNGKIIQGRGERAAQGLFKFGLLK